MEQTGWKLVHGDVFRAPKHSFWYALSTVIYRRCCARHTLFCLRCPDVGTLLGCAWCMVLECSCCAWRVDPSL
jgi:hypothetical protein